MGVVSTGQITIVDMNDVTIATSQPLNPNVNQLWLDTSVVPNQLKRWDGSKWLIVNDVQVGGRNLLRSAEIKYKYGTLTDSTTEKISGSGKWFVHFPVNLIPGQQYTVSNKSITNTSTVRLNNVNISLYNSAINTARMTVGVLKSGESKTFTAPSTMVDGDNILFYVSDGAVQSEFEIQGLKLEKGNIATDWTPAPEDIPAVINEDLDNLDQRLVELSNSTSETVEEFKRTVSATYINTTDFGAYQTEVNSKFSQTVEGFNFEWNTLKTAIETVDTNATEEFNDIRKYIRFIDGKMILGEESNALSLEVRSNMIVFLHGDTPVAYFDNNKLYVTEGEFTVSLRIGKFAFTPRTNGNLSFGKVV